MITVESEVSNGGRKAIEWLIKDVGAYGEVREGGREVIKWKVEVEDIQKKVSEGNRESPEETSLPVQLDHYFSIIFDER